MGCKCNKTLSNTGAPNCPNIFEETAKLIFVNEFTGAGTRNFIDMSGTINQAFIDGKLNNTDTSVRWYPTPGALENVSMTRAETVFQTFDSGNKARIRKGTRSFAGMMVNADPRLVGKIDEFGCVRAAVYIVDIDGNLIGSRRDGDESTKLYPILISQGSFDSTFNFKTNDAVQNGMIVFDISRIEQDENLYMMRANEIDGDLLSIEGLYDVIPTYSSITTAGFTVTLKTDWGTPVTGLVIGDFYDEIGGSASSAYNVTDSAAVALDTVTESATTPGQYAVVYDTAVTSGDEIRVTIQKSKFDFTRVSDKLVETP